MSAALKKLSFECYYPVKVEEKNVGGRMQRIEKPAVNSLLFFQSSISEAEEVQQKFDGKVMLYTYRLSRQPAVIPDQEMKVFKLVSSSGEQNLEYMDADAINFKTGQHVHVTGGPFQGAEGYIKRIRGNKRLVVAIEGIVAVVTTYIPSCYLEPME